MCTNESDLAPYRLCMDEFGGDKTLIKSFTIPWSGDEWLAVLNKEGEWLPSCCGTISAARDMLMETLREGAEMDVTELRAFVETLGAHDGFPPTDPHNLRPDDESPVMRLFWLWEAIKGRAAVADRINDAPRPCDLDDVSDAAHALERMLWGLSMMPLVEGQDAIDGKGGFVKRVSPYKATGLPARSHVRRIEMLRRGLPAIRTLAQHLQRTDPGPFEGVALVEIATGNVPEGFGGLAIYESEEKAREILGYWERNPENRGKYEPRRARVSMAAGLEILPA